MKPAIFEERQDQIHRKGEAPFKMDCDRECLAGAVSQRACVFCGSQQYATEPVGSSRR